MRYAESGKTYYSFSKRIITSNNDPLLKERPQRLELTKDKRFFVSLHLFTNLKRPKLKTLGILKLLVQQRN